MTINHSKHSANAVGSHFAHLAGGFYAVECSPEPPFTVSTPLKPTSETPFTVSTPLAPIPSRRRHPQRRWYPFRAAVGTLYAVETHFRDSVHGFNAVETRTRDSGENLNRVETHNEDKETNNKQ